MVSQTSKDSVEMNGASTEQHGLPPDRFHELYKEHHAEVLRNLRRLLGHEQDAEDAAQEVWSIVHRKGKTFRGESQFSTWLHRVTFHVAASARRKRSRLPKTGHCELLLERVDHDRDSSENIPDAWPAVEAEFQKLREMDRFLLRAHYFDHMTHKDIAQVFHPPQPVGTIKQRMWQARHTLRKRLGRTGGGVEGCLGNPQ